MRILVTGSRGKVGSATVDALHQAGHEVTACDIGAPVFEAAGPDVPRYQQADLTDAGDAFAVVRGHDAVIHAAALPEPTPQPAPPRLPQQPDGVVQHARGGGPLGRPALRQRVERDRPRASSSPSARSCPTTRRSTRSTRSARRTRTRPPSTSRELLCDAADAALGHPLHHDPPELGPVGGQLRPQPRRRAARPVRRRPAPRCGPTSTSTTSPTRCAWPPSPTSTPTRSSTSPAPTTARNRPLRGADPPPPRRRDRAARARPPRRARPQHREGPAAARLRPAALLARLPDRGRRAARRRRASGSTPATPASSAAARSL